MQVESSLELSSDHSPVNATMIAHAIGKSIIPTLITNKQIGTAFVHT
jgi:hypothetical protein